jgi:hypothetical protein
MTTRVLFTCVPPLPSKPPIRSPSLCMAATANVRSASTDDSAAKRTLLKPALLQRPRTSGQSPDCYWVLRLFAQPPLIAWGRLRDGPPVGRHEDDADSEVGHRVSLLCSPRPYDSKEIHRVQLY